jgi:hypothetical protein
VERIMMNPLVRFLPLACLPSLCLALPLSGAYPAEPAQKPLAKTARVSVARFGAVADDGRNDAEALRKAVEYCKAHPGTTLYFPAGVYDLRDEEAVRLMDDVMGGKMGQNPEKTIFRAYYPYVRGLDFRGLSNITVEAAGAVLQCDGWMEPLSLNECRGITVKGLTIDYKRKPYSVGKVVEVGADYFDAVFDEAYPLNAKMPVPRLLFWDVQAHRLFPDPVYFPRKFEITAPHTMRIHTHVKPEWKGNLVGIEHSFHFRPAILIQDAANIRLEDVTIHAQPGMGIVGHRSSNITLEGLRVVPSPGSFISTNTDATHFTTCSGYLRLLNCQFEGQGDDSMNIHNYYYSLRKSEQAGAYDLVVNAPTGTHAQVLDYPDPGDRLELVRISSLETVKTYTVKSRTNFPKQWRTQVTLNAPLPSDLEKYYLINASRLPSVEVRGCSIMSHLARGMLIKSRNVKIERNLIRETTGTGIHVGAESDWLEGLPSANVSIRYNRILRCGRGTGSQNGTSGIAVKIDAPDTSVPGLHKNLLIEGNVIEGEDAARCITVSQVEDAIIRYNEFSGCKDPVVVEHSERVKVYSNTAAR